MMIGLVYRFGRCELRPDQRQLLVDGRPEPLEPRPFELLLLLLKNRERLVSKDELLDHLWPHEAVGPGSIAVAVFKVRKAIRDNGTQPLIRTVHRVGYRFAAMATEEPARSLGFDAGPARHLNDMTRLLAPPARHDQLLVGQG